MAPLIVFVVALDGDVAPAAEFGMSCSPHFIALSLGSLLIHPINAAGFFHSQEVEIGCDHLVYITPMHTICCVLHGGFLLNFVKSA